MNLWNAFSGRPTNLGVVDGRLSDCPETPNCVSTFAKDSLHHIEPLQFSDLPDEAMTRLKEIIMACPRTRIVTTTNRYFHVEFTSCLLRFVDDVEFLLDPDARLIHFRSASRVGRSDLGVNRRRMEAIRRRFGPQ